MEIVNWERYPSVRRGGKPTFLTAQTSQGRFWIVWNRIEGMLSVDKMACPRNEVLALVKTEAQGKRIVADYLKKHN